MYNYTEQELLYFEELDSYDPYVEMLDEEFLDFDLDIDDDLFEFDDEEE